MHVELNAAAAQCQRRAMPPPRMNFMNWQAGGGRNFRATPGGGVARLYVRASVALRRKFPNAF